MINFFQFKINKNHVKYFLIFGWISCWASLSFSPYNLIFFTENTDLSNLTKHTLFKFFDIGRGLFQIIYLPVLIVLSLILNKRKKIFFKLDSFYFLFLIIFLIEIFSTLKSDNPNINIYFIICSLNIILTLFLLKNFFPLNNLFLIFKVSIIILVGILIFFGTQYFIVALRDGINIYGSWGNINKYLYDVPRPTGLARTALICFIFFVNIKFFKKSFDKINFIIIIISSVLVILLSSRTIVFLFFLYIIFHIFYFKIFKLKNLFILLKNFILIPFVVIVLFESLHKISKNYTLNGKIGNTLNFSLKDIARDYPEIKKKHCNGHYVYCFKGVQKSDFTNNRLRDWKNILKYNENILLGNGVLGDRYLIKQSASNLVLYTFSSSGLVGLLIILCISLIAFFKVYKNIFTNKPKFEPYKYVGSIIIIILILRSILETSYGVFGIDFILFCLCFTLITTNKNTHESN